MLREFRKGSKVTGAQLVLTRDRKVKVQATTIDGNGCEGTFTAPAYQCKVVHGRKNGRVLVDDSVPAGWHNRYVVELAGDAKLGYEKTLAGYGVPRFARA